jgi:hypothetical protein
MAWKAFCRKASSCARETAIGIGRGAEGEVEAFQQRGRARAARFRLTAGARQGLMAGNRRRPMRRTAALPALLLLAACSQAEDMRRASPEEMDVMEMAPPPAEVAPEPAPAGAPAAVPVAAPQIAYKYQVGYTVAAERLDAAQRAHVALCDRLGPARCRVLSMNRNAADGEFASGALALEVDARIARAFGAELDKAAAGVGGETASRSTEAEDLSKAMVDTEARIRAKQALADRLLRLINQGGGKVGELVEAERAFAQAQEELDAARGWLGQMRTRVATSRYDISYSSRAPSGSGVLAPVRDALRGAGQAFGWSVAAVITAFVVLLPWAAALVLIGLLFRRLGWFRGWRWPWRRRQG